MGPKRGAAQLQVEITDDEQFELFINKKGLGLIDIYSGWAGPCSAMVPFLKRIKVDFGDKGDLLNFAIAKNDAITPLERFRGKSEPHWMFVSRGMSVGLYVGANYPRLEDAIIDEFKKQLEADEGNDTRTYITVATLTPTEQKIADVKAENEKRRLELELEKFLQKQEDRRLEIAYSIADKNELVTCIIIFPVYAKREKKLKELRKKLDAAKFGLQEKTQRQITDEQIENFQKFAGMDISPRAIEMMQDGRAYIWLLKCDEEFLLDPVEYVFARILYGEHGEPPGDVESPISKFIKVLPWPIEEEEEEEEEIEESEKEKCKEESEGEEEEEEEGEEEERKSEKPKEEAPPAEDKKKKKKEPETKKESDTDEDMDEEMDGEVICCIWTPLTPYKIARATVLYEFFYDTMLPYIPVEPLPIPPHVACIYPAAESQKIMEVIEDGKFMEEILNYGFFNSSDPVNHNTVANCCLDYVSRPIHMPDEVFVLSVAQKRSYPLITLAELQPKYVSENTDTGLNDCLQWFPSTWVQGTEFVEEESEEEEESKNEEKSEESEEGEEELSEEELERIKLKEIEDKERIEKRLEDVLEQEEETESGFTTDEPTEDLSIS